MHRSMMASVNTGFATYIWIIDCYSLFQVVQLISSEILPYANFIPKDFVGKIMTMLNKGSIHSQSSSFTGKCIKNLSFMSVETCTTLKHLYAEIFLDTQAKITVKYCSDFQQFQQVQVVCVSA